MQVQCQYAHKGETPAHYQERYVDWQTKMGMVDWDSLIVNGMIAKDPSLASQRDYLSSLYASSEAYRLRDMVFAGPITHWEKKRT